MRREATCKCCRRNDAPEGKSVCTSCASYIETALAEANRRAEKLGADFRREHDKTHRQRQRAEAAERRANDLADALREAAHALLESEGHHDACPVWLDEDCGCGQGETSSEYRAARAALDRQEQR
jgi:hypothetical protein